MHFVFVNKPVSYLKQLLQTPYHHTQAANSQQPLLRKVLHLQVHWLLRSESLVHLQQPGIQNKIFSFILSWINTD